jgi:hypothetical protein
VLDDPGSGGEELRCQGGRRPGHTSRNVMVSHPRMTRRATVNAALRRLSKLNQIN